MPPPPEDPPPPPEPEEEEPPTKDGHAEDTDEDIDYDDMDDEDGDEDWDDEDWWDRGDCPGVEFIAEESGTHHIVVSGYDCDGETAVYEIGVDAGSDPMLTLIADDIDSYTMIGQTHMVEGTATITE